MGTEKSPQTESEIQSNSAGREEGSGSSADALGARASDPALTEDEALALLKRSDLPAEALEQIGKHGSLVKSRKVRIALVSHPNAPRHVSVPMVRHLYTFDLMRVALTPVVPADVKVAADEALMGRLETVSLGEKLSLARRASGRVASALLEDPDARVTDAALENARLTETSIVKALMRREVTERFVMEICRHPKWSLRHEIRVALLRNSKTPLAKALEFARELPPGKAREILEGSELPQHAKYSLLEELGESHL